MVVWSNLPSRLAQATENFRCVAVAPVSLASEVRSDEEQRRNSCYCRDDYKCFGPAHRVILSSPASLLGRGRFYAHLDVESVFRVVHQRRDDGPRDRLDVFLQVRFDSHLQFLFVRCEPRF